MKLHALPHDEHVALMDRYEREKDRCVVRGEYDLTKVKAMLENFTTAELEDIALTVGERSHI